MFNVTPISKCSIIFCNVLGFMSDFAIHIRINGMTADMGRYLWHFRFINFIILLTDMLEIFLRAKDNYWHIIFVQIQKTHFTSIIGSVLGFLRFSMIFRKHFFISYVIGTGLVPHSIFISSITYSVFAVTDD